MVISTGGTIAGNIKQGQDDAEARQPKKRQKSKGSDTVEPGHMGADDLLDLVKNTEAHLKNNRGISLKLKTRDLLDVDSSYILPEHWTAVADEIIKSYSEADGFVVTHGTNTLGYTSAALSFALGHSPKPILVTGAQIPAEFPASDGIANLENAIRIAAGAGPDIRGVATVFGSHLITGARAKKSTEFDLDAFQTFSAGSIGRVGRILDVNEANLNTHNELATLFQPHGQTFQPEAQIQDGALKPHSGFKTRGIVSISEFPGADGSMLARLLDDRTDGADPVEAVIVRSFGAGDVSETLRPLLYELREREIPAVITTQAPNGRANFNVNEPGQLVAREELGIAGEDMSIESITTKLAWFLDMGYTYREIKRQMRQNLRGEITPKREHPW